jgi:hypothetical protein
VEDCEWVGGKCLMEVLHRLLFWSGDVCMRDYYIDSEGCAEYDAVSSRFQR